MNGRNGTRLRIGQQRRHAISRSDGDRYLWGVRDQRIRIRPTRRRRRPLADYHDVPAVDLTRRNDGPGAYQTGHTAPVVPRR
jgi:hypothetical protein